MKKQEQILKLLSEDVSVGDSVVIKYPYRVKTDVYGKGKNKREVVDVIYTDVLFVANGTVTEIANDIVVVSSTTSTRIPSGISYSYDGNIIKILRLDKRYVTKDISKCGANPFMEDIIRIDFYNIDIESLLSRCGYNINYSDGHKIFTDRLDSSSSRGVSFNPFIIDSDGNKKYYQREYVWGDSDKQLLIESIYNGIEIGKFLFRYNSWSRIQKYVGEVFSFDCVDGKQRLNAIIDFISNKFPDLHGNYWNELSNAAQGKFLRYGNMSYGQMAEDATDKDVLNCFLKLNFSGKVMSMEHINYVKSIKI